MLSILLIQHFIYGVLALVFRNDTLHLPHSLHIVELMADAHELVYPLADFIVVVFAHLRNLYLIVEGFFKLKAAFASKKNSVKAWFVPLILGLLSIVLGVLIIYLGLFTTKVFVIIFGIVLIYAGVQNIVNMFFISKD